MMFYTSKLVNDVMAKQAAADVTLEGFSSGVRDAIALAEHFECITPEEYVLPSGWAVDEPAEQHPVMSEAGLWVGEYSRL